MSEPSEGKGVSKLGDYDVKFNDWLGFLGLIISLIILWQFRQILLLVFMAVVLATALNSIVRSLVNKFNLSRGKSILVTLVGVILASTLFVIFMVPPFVDQLEELIKLIPVGFEQLIVRVNSFIDNPPSWFPEFDFKLLPDFDEIYQQLNSLAPQVFTNFLTFFSNSTAILLQLLLILILTLMFLVEPLAYRHLLLQFFPSSYRGRAEEIISKSEVGLLAWLKGVSINSLFVAILCGVGLLVLRIPFVFAHAILAGVFNFIPNIGPSLSAVFPVAVALLHSPGKAIAVIIWYFIVQNVESYWFSPLVMKKQVNLLPAATLIAQIFFATFLGFLGLILALPLAVVVKTWAEEALIKDFFNNM
ncbi:MAG: AI-2E family transporter [Xenococcaceae cyanobacterium MO_207.B15]|nr:AI-2E family transporter [Xenococcaceae cyanobacterium MO_207.B15]